MTVIVLRLLETQKLFHDPTVYLPQFLRSAVAQSPFGLADADKFK